MIQGKRHVAFIGLKVDVRDAPGTGGGDDGAGVELNGGRFAAEVLDGHDSVRGAGGLARLGAGGAEAAGASAGLA